MDRRQELAALGALDHAVVVGARERHDLAHPHARDRLEVGAFELRRVVDRSDADNETLTRHEARHGVLRPDHARVRDRDRRRREVVDGDLAVANPAQQLLVGAVELREVEGVGGLQVGHE